MATKKAAIHTETSEEKEVILHVYEVGYHVVPTMKEEDIDSVVSTIRGSIEKSGGSFIAEGAPTNMRLAYPMTVHQRGKNIYHDRAYFGWIKFESSVDAVQALDEALKKDKEILRYIIFRTVREDTRANIKVAPLRDVRRSDALKQAPRKEEQNAPINEEDINKAIEDLTIE